MPDHEPEERQFPADSQAQAFDPFPAVSDRLSELTSQPLLDWLGYLLPEHGGNALDLGCGTGAHSVLLGRAVRRGCGCGCIQADVGSGQGQRSRPNVVYVHSELQGITPERDGPFDVVLSAFALHHVEDRELEAVLEQIRALVAPGGRAVLVDIVARRGRIPRWRRYLEAARRFPGDWLDRGLRQAAEVYSLRTDPAWLAHLDADCSSRPRTLTDAMGQCFRGRDSRLLTGA